MEDKPVWKSKKAVVYLATLCAAIATSVYGLDIAELLASGCAYGLPVLLGAQSVQDFAIARSKK
jgi:hypothetical protein